MKAWKNVPKVKCPIHVHLHLGNSSVLVTLTSVIFCDLFFTIPSPQRTIKKTKKKEKKKKKKKTTFCVSDDERKTEQENHYSGRVKKE